ncbi:MAG: ATP-binding protein [Bacteroidota bacterium]|nr:ATP-binding protein [Bacteroidota bacterium]
MQKSDELQNIITVVFKKLLELNVVLNGACICTFVKDSKDIIFWIAVNEQFYSTAIRVPHINHPVQTDFWEAKESGKASLNKRYSVEEKNSIWAYSFANTDFKYLPEERKKFILESKGYAVTVAFEKHCAVAVNNFNGILLSENDTKILQRFVKVFEQCYTRFLDLQKAEAQAKEAQIEAALERVRSRSMAMQKSEELKEVIQVVYDQFVHLNINVEHTGFIIDYNTRDNMFIWLADKHEVPVQINIPYFDSPHWNSFIKAKASGENFFTNLLSFEEKNRFYEDLFKLFPVPDEAKDYYFSAAGLAISTVLLDGVGLYIENFEGIPFSDEDNKTLVRFGKVFQQTYTRFNDLKRSEAQVKEAQIEAALERVRSRTLAMQKSDELAETSAVLFKQLIGLGIEPNRLYISIMKDDAGESEFWITDEEGSKVSSAYTDNLNSNESFKKMFDGWKAGKSSMIIDMKGKELKEYFNHLTSLGVQFKEGLKQKRRIQHLAFFNRGFIGMAAPDDQPEDTIHLLERFAAVFNLTFTRFNDLKVAEAHALQAEQDLIEIKAARKKAEEALRELQVTQNQLIQKEKMASLGELTAGIAHEIQNPLNFVNNFSEVSKELLDEMKAALKTGDREEAEEIANDIIKNLEKINHHGRRADAIVKGMLQHSQSSSGQKELTDINALCDEYLRLSFHGLRAKDKSFNADFKTDFDETIGKINIVPQDIGRVLLNVINNAFYAVNERQKITKEIYQPTVFLSSKKIGGQVVLTVTDNGNGVPQNIVDKIFQPFFTTKPTGQGTGLGLSLSYDIIKAHGGEIKVETKEGEGSTFIIHLPNQ